MSVWSIIACVVLGIFFIGNYFYTRRENRRIESWPTTKGTIISSRFFPGGNRVSPRFTVVYEYTVNGQRYQSDRIYTNHREFAVSGVEEVERLEFFRNPVVKYDPENPARCCLLLYPTNWLFVALLVLGIILLIIGLGGALMRIV